MNHRLWGVEEMAIFLGIARTTLYAMVSQKRVPHIKVGRLVKFDPKSIEGWLKQHSVEERKW